MTGRQLCAAVLGMTFIVWPLAYVGALGMLYVIAWAIEDMTRYGLLTFVLGVACGLAIRRAPHTSPEERT